MSPSPRLSDLVGRWLEHAKEWQYNIGWCPQTYAGPAEFRLAHPAPLELIGLPKHFDVLMEEANSKRCPTTGKDLVDPALCLFCGAIFCSQAVCCMKYGVGSANQHVKKCSFPVGIFLSIRKCTIILLHMVPDPPPRPARPSTRGSGSSMLTHPPPTSPSTETTPTTTTNANNTTPTAPTTTTTTTTPTATPPIPAIHALHPHNAHPHPPTPSGPRTNGSWFHAPYLTRHGEVDPGLRQRHQLLLSQKRYDRLLRECWLMGNGGGNVWSTIARKLEGEINGGGWESI